MKFSIRTFGCQMNVYDSTRMAALLSAHGHAETAEMKDADLVIFNTCHIREKADHKFSTDLGFLRAETEKKPIVVLAGCIAQASGEEVLRKYPFVHIAVGPKNYHRLPELIAEYLDKRAPFSFTDLKDDGKFDALPPVLNSDVSTYLTIQEGCNRFCSYCVVPLTRGREYSRPMKDVIDEAKALARLGARELTLLGQNVDVYHGADESGQTRSLATLFERLSEIPELFRIRYTTSYPSDFSEDLMRAHRDLPKVQPYLHLPVQAGSDRILKLMNRRYTSAEYLAKLDQIRSYVSDIALASDFIVGFPSETEEDFEKTLQLVKDVNYAMSFSFKYSARPLTRAADMPDQVPEEVKGERLIRLQDLLLSQQKSFNDSKIGRILPVLVERKGKGAGEYHGKSPYMQTVVFHSSSDLMGKVVDVKIQEATLNTLKGEVV